MMCTQKEKALKKENKKLDDQAKAIKAQIKTLESTLKDPIPAAVNKILTERKAKHREVLSEKKDANKELYLYKSSLLGKVDVILSTLCFSGNSKMRKYFEGRKCLLNSNSCSLNKESSQ